MFSVPLNPIVLAASNSILHFLTSIHNHEITQIVSGSFFASQGLPAKMPLILPVLHLPSTPSNTSEKDLREKKKSLLSLDPCFSATSLVPCNLQGNGNQEFVQLLQVFQEGSFLHGMLLHHDW